MSRGILFACILFALITITSGCNTLAMLSGPADPEDECQAAYAEAMTGKAACGFANDEDARMKCEASMNLVIANVLARCPELGDASS